MGGHFWFYIVQYQRTVEHTLRLLQEREFKAGRYNPVVPFPKFPVDNNSYSPGAQHRSMTEALKASGADGTRTILDIVRLGENPEPGVARRLTDGRLIELFGTTRPTREMVGRNNTFLEDVDRGQAIYLVLYTQDAPSEILFAGCSYD